jgi:4-hydroxybenzoate polyprenyltransferase
VLVAGRADFGFVSRLRDGLRLLRFRAWAHFLPLPLAGLDPAAPNAPALARGVAAAFCILGFGYLANAVGDRGMDRDRAKNPLVGRAPPRLGGTLAALALIALLLAANGPLALLAAALSLSSGWAYSLGPRLKRVPLLGTLMNVLNFAPLLCLGLGGTRLPSPLAWLLPAFAALLVQNQLLHEAADAAEDRAGAVRTTFLALGPVGAGMLAAMAAALVMAAAGRALAFGGRPPAWALLLGAPFLMVFPALLAWRGRSAVHMARARVAQRCCAAAAGLLLFGLGL